ncbi:MAG: xanthine dehydrogenase family protein subunit M [Gammaproteobacteria bacterium]|nr:xanthine dehydrogenase family protein subunit M [Gammaproteobacteria bacterium]
MKPPPFSYHDPRSLDDALELLVSLDDAKLLAGGQSLMPMLNMRFIMPEHVIDLNRIPDLSAIEENGGGIRIGAMVRQSELEFSDLIRSRCPLMSEALRLVGHRPTRNRGTMGGSLCNLDPAAELPVVAAALDARIGVRSGRGERSLAMSEFPAFYMTPAIEADEIVTHVEFDPWPKGHGFAFVEFARRHGDFAIVAAAALVVLEGDGTVSRASITLGGVGFGPLRCSDAETAVVGSGGGEEIFRKAAETCRGIDAMEDVHASSAYRRHLAETLVYRALQSAFDRAASGSSN